MPLTEDQKAARAERRRTSVALTEEARYHRREAKHREWVEHGMHLTREQASAGEPCRGCGLPVIDNLGDWPPTMHLTPEERIEHETADAQFRGLHPDCDAHRWSMSGSRATHCGLCCPPVPLSQEQVEHLGRLLAGVPEHHEDELDTWQRILTCGHRVERQVHHTNQSPSFSTEWCPACEQTRGVVTSEQTIEAGARAAESTRKRDEEIARAERDVARAEKVTVEARKKLAELRAGDVLGTHPAPSRKRTSNYEINRSPSER